MLKKRNAQSIMEYVTVISIVFAILIPMLYILQDYVIESSDKITTARIESIAREIISNAEEIFLLGPPSSIIIEVNMPEDIESLTIAENTLIFGVGLSTGTSELTYESDANIRGAFTPEELGKGPTKIRIYAINNYVEIDIVESEI